MTCQLTSSAALEVQDVGSCQTFQAGVRYTLKDLSPSNCKYLLHSVYPYRLTLERGGYFKWVLPGEGVIAKCPSVFPSVETSTFNSETTNEVETRVLAVRGRCPSGYESGQKMDFSKVPCLKLLSQLLPLMLDPNLKSAPITCQGCAGKPLRGVIKNGEV